MPALKDLTGRKFGNLTVRNRAPDRTISGKSAVYWWCRCKCGGLLSVGAASLMHGDQKYCKPCGDKVAGQKRHREQSTGFVDWTGERVGKLTVLRREMPLGRPVKWRCRCDCGGIAVVAAGNLAVAKKSGSGACWLCGRRKGQALMRLATLGRRSALKTPAAVRGARWLSVDTHGTKFALVDPDTFDRVKDHVWYTDRYGYPHSKDERGRFTQLHHVAAGVGPGVHVDHKDRNVLDCRRKNLRVADKSKNGANAAKTKGQVTSQFKGVCWDARQSAWRAYVTVRGTRLELGRFLDEARAAKAYDAAAREHFKEFARVNFPRKGEQPALGGGSVL